LVNSSLPAKWMQKWPCLGLFLCFLPPIPPSNPDVSKGAECRRTADWIRMVGVTWRECARRRFFLKWIRALALSLRFPICFIVKRLSDEVWIELNPIYDYSEVEDCLGSCGTAECVQVDPVNKRRLMSTSPFGSRKWTQFHTASFLTKRKSVRIILILDSMTPSSKQSCRHLTLSGNQERDNTGLQTKSAVCDRYMLQSPAKSH
jgi:hypothetical protein